MTVPRLDLAARETGPWTWQGVILREDAVAWSCRHAHDTQAAAFTCARHARLTVCPQGRSAVDVDGLAEALLRASAAAARFRQRLPRGRRSA